MKTEKEILKEIDRLKTRHSEILKDGSTLKSFLNGSCIYLNEQAKEVEINISLLEWVLN